MYTYTAKNYKESDEQTKFYFIVGNVSEAKCRNQLIKYEVVYKPKDALIHEPFVVKLKVDGKPLEVIGAYDNQSEANKICSYYNSHQKIKVNKN